MAEEKEQNKFEETTSDHAARPESGDTIDEKRLLRKLDRHLVPGLTLLLLISLLDRGNVGNALIEGLITDLHLDSTKLLVVLTMSFATYVLFELPANILLKLTAPRSWLPALAFTWGIICVLSGLAQNFSSFLCARFFMGLVDSGFIPGVVFYMSMWYRRNEQLFRISLLLCTASIAGAFGGLFAFGIAKMRGIAGLNGWRWIFIIEGLMTVLASIVGYFLIHNYPATAKFLTPEEKEHVIARLKEDSDAIREEKFKWGGVLQALKDPKIWLYCLAFHTLNLPSCTLGVFLPKIINELGYTAAQAQLLTVPPNVAAFILTMGSAVFAERTRWRAPFILADTTLGLIGYILLIVGTRAEVLYGGAMMAYSGSFSAAAIIISWPANNVSGQTKRATASALQLSIGNIGSVIGIQLYRSEWAPKYYVAHFLAVGYLIANIIVVCTLWYFMKSENARRDRGERDDRLKDVDEGIFLGDDDPRWRFQT